MTEGDVRFLKNIYPEDMGGKKVLTGRIWHAPVSHGRIRSLNIPEPPKGITVLTSKDIPGKNQILTGGHAMPVLAAREIRYPGQSILLAAGNDTKKLDRYLKTISADIEELSPLPGPGAGPETQEVFFERIMERGSIDDQFSSAFQIVEREFSTGSQDPNL